MLKKWFCKTLLIMNCLFALGVANVSYADHAFQDTEGKAVSLKNLRGKWVIVSYWADWCSGCVKEVPELNHFYKTHHDSNVVLYGVNYDQLPLDNLKDAMNRIDIHYPVLVGDPNEAWHLGEVPVLPATFILNPKGRVVKELYGAGSEEALIATLQELQKNA